MSDKSMNDPILKVEHLSMKFGGLVAISDLSLEAKRGEITAIIGPNGAGKTTVFNCITGFYRPTGGMLTLTRKNGEIHLLERMPDFLITAKAKVARTFQNIRLFPGLTVFENLLVAQHNTLMKSSGYTILGLLGLPGYKRAQKAAMEKAKQWLEKIDLIDKADDPAGDLPYGAQRRLEIARAMCTDPELLCLDEPAAGLNPRESADLSKLLLDIRNDIGTSILLIEHDMSVVMEISDHVIVLEYGIKISDGLPNVVNNDPKVIAAYLGVEDEDIVEFIEEINKPNSAAPTDDIVSSLARKAVSKTGYEKKSPSTTNSIPAKIMLNKASSKEKKILSNTLSMPRDGKPDELTRIKGINAVIERKLNKHGVYHFDQIAVWKKADIVLIETYLGYDGRIVREDWCGQAKKLASDILSRSKKSSQERK